MAERIEELLRAAAAGRPEAVALMMGERSLTYRELSERVNAMAAAVSVTNAGRGPVAIHAAKTIETVVCMMGCLVAGVPYVPVDASLPPARRAVVLDLAGSALFLYDGTRAPAPPGVAGSSADVVDMASLPDGQPDEGPAADRAEIAYILFTSGSTGTPKGVVITHANLLSALEWAEPRVGWAPEEGDQVLCYAPLHFDIYPLDVYGAMATGATVVLADDRSILFPQATADLIARHEITYMMAVPSAWIALLRLDPPGEGQDPLASLRRVIYSGEEFPAGWLRTLAGRLPQARIINIYGLVETTPVIGLEVGAEHLALDRIPLGYPLGPNRVFLLGDDGVPLTGPGAQGEIAAHGPSLSPRYLMDDATKAAWAEVTVAPDARLACFRTGDFGEYGDDGIIHFRGRRDHRVKTRGHRVELGDVEAALASHPDVVVAVAVPRPHADVTNEIVAFAESRDASLGERDLIAWARQLLPAYMVPREVVVTGSLPKTATGKADRQALLRRVTAS